MHCDKHGFQNVLPLIPTCEIPHFKYTSLINERCLFREQRWPASQCVVCSASQIGMYKASSLYGSNGSVVIKKMPRVKKMIRIQLK